VRLRFRAEMIAMHTGDRLLRPGRSAPLRRLGSFLYHWGSGRPDLHRSDYGTRTIPRFRRGGMIPGRGIPVKIADGERITTPERAEQLGLTVEARRMREGRKP
jgi:hypothetical protein